MGEVLNLKDIKTVLERIKQHLHLSDHKLTCTSPLSPGALADTEQHYAAKR